jgi:hypothetical protein
MRVSIRHSSSYLIEFDRFAVNGRMAAGGYAFTFTLRGWRQGCEVPVAIFDMRLSLSVFEPTRLMAASIPSSNQVVQCNSYPSNNEQIFFEIVLTKDQVNALEECRQEGDLKLGLGLSALTSSGSGLLPSSDTTDVLIPREHWLTALESAGFRQTLLFEVPLPPVSDGLIGTLSKAQEFIEIGHYKDAVMQCRHIIEQVESVRADKKLSGAANVKAHGTERREMTSTERLLSLREQLKNVCQLGAHGSERFTRSQAKAVLGVTMALLSEPTVGFTEDLSRECVRGAEK